MAMRVVLRMLNIPGIAVTALEIDGWFRPETLA
jgi:hypothetical protein